MGSAIGAVEDAARVGEPAEETIFYHWWSALSGFGCEGPPQVLHVVSLGVHVVSLSGSGGSHVSVWNYMWFYLNYMFKDACVFLYVSM